MTTERDLSDVKITVEDFNQCGWEEVLNSVSPQNCLSISQAFGQAAKKAIESGNLAHGKVLGLLSDACSMMLHPEDIMEPFTPMIVMGNKRSALPADFFDDVISFFAQIVDSINNAWLKSRLADLVWLRQQKRDVHFALAAIDAYRGIPLQADSLARGGYECWERALLLTRILRDGAGNRLKEMERVLVQALFNTTKDDGLRGFTVADLLKRHGLGHNDGDAIAKKLHALATELDGEGQLHTAREYFKAAAEWFKGMDDEANAVAMTVAWAETWVKEAYARLSSDAPSHRVAASFYENAIQIYRTIPHKERSVHHVDERISELRTLMNESNQKALGEMKRVQTNASNITKLVEVAQSTVRGKPAREAMLEFCNLEPLFNVSEARKRAVETLRQSPLLGLFSMRIVSRDGRTIAKPTGMDLDGITGGDETAVKAQMILDYEIHIGLVVQGMIWPALETLRLEHHLRERDFAGLVSQSPIVPKDRVRLFGKALFEGYNGDFVAALHILAPQIEHMIRYHLKQAGTHTTILDSQGIETEIGMSALMERPQAKDFLGPDLYFELNTLFCDPMGPNLRNEIAHGLLDDDAILSVYSIYAWWLALKLVFNTFWNTTMEPQREDKPNGDTQ